MTTRLAPRRWSLVVFPLALAFGLAACGDEGRPRERVGEVREELFANDKTIYEYFVAKGLTPFQAAGIVGNLDQESGGSPTAVQGGGPGRGVAQWSVGGRWDTDANDNATAFANGKGQSVWSLQLQLDFIWYELTTFPGYGLGPLKASTNVTDATVVFQDKFEGCGTCAQGQRVAYAMAVLAAYGATSAPPYAAKFVSQTYPYASVGPVKVTVGQIVTGSIVMQNVGTKPWKAGSTKLAPIPRDQASPFQADNWLTNARVSTVASDVAPGANGTFAWDLKGSAPGDFSPYFGFVEEGVTWFADAPNGGGPPDNDLQVHIVVAPAPAMGAGGSGAAGGSGKSGAGGSSAAGKGGSPAAGAGGSSAAGKGGSGAGASAGAPGTGGAGPMGGAGFHSAGGTSSGGQSATAGGAAGSSLAAGGNGVAAAGAGDAAAAETTSSGGCQMAARPAPSVWAFASIAALAAVVLRRRRSTLAAR